MIKICSFIWGINKIFRNPGNCQQYTKKNFIGDKSTEQFYFEITLKKKICAGSINNCLRC
jgi:hypothetical protein